MFIITYIVRFKEKYKKRLKRIDKIEQMFYSNFIRTFVL